MTITGEHLIGRARSREAETTFEAVDPRSGAPLPPRFAEATDTEVDRAAQLASLAARELRLTDGASLARLLEGVAAGIGAAGDALLERAEQETALPRARLEGERARTVGQLRAFAQLVATEGHRDVAREAGDPARLPAPRPELAVVATPIGPVAVFGASNFPLAFSVAGGDTASALAAGCPVIAKAHPAHPGTSEILGTVIRDAVESAGLPEGTFSLLQGATARVGLELVRHPLVRAVGFTGSLRAGRAIFDAAAARPAPIPVHAEMGSINPVFVLDGALAERGSAIAKGMVQSMALGVGQFCTNPGLLLLSRSAAADAFLEELATLVATTPAGTMLHRGIRDGYVAGLDRLAAVPGVALRARVEAPAGAGGCDAGAALLETDAGRLGERAELLEEVFGPATLAVRCASPGVMEAVAAALPGQLTATIHGGAADHAVAATLAEILADRAGRLVWNGFPTGVEVSSAMHHGGPWPATTHPGATSVGTRAIRRFLRPVCYQGFPEDLLPSPLRAPAP